MTSVLIGQEINIETILENSIEESSGLIHLNGRFITHNDSYGEPALYEFNPISGNVIRTVIIENADNIDWEDICYDSTYIYIGDFGNNSGARTNLKIYLLSIQDYLNTPNDTVSVDTIIFNYADQIDFTPTSNSTNFDAEAIISYEDSLYIFTKNWGNNWANIYAIPKMPGQYSITKIDSINSNGLITGATYNPINEKVLLSGYTLANAFIIEIGDISNLDFSGSTINQYNIYPPNTFSYQIESITYLDNNQYYLTAEGNAIGNPALYSLTTNLELETYINESKISPNPTNGLINIDSINEYGQIRLFNINGKEINIVKSTYNNSVSINFDEPPGIYIIQIENKGILESYKIVNY